MRGRLLGCLLCRLRGRFVRFDLDVMSAWHDLVRLLIEDEDVEGRAQVLIGLPCTLATLILNRFRSSSTFLRPLSMKSSKRALNSDMRMRRSSKLKLSWGRFVAGLLARRCVEEEREFENKEAGRSSWVVMIAEVVNSA